MRCQKCKAVRRFPLTLARANATFAVLSVHMALFEGPFD
jgi:hypothetical protein